MARLLPAFILACSALVNANSLAFTKVNCLTLLGNSSVTAVPSYTTIVSKTITLTTKSTSLQTSTVTPSAVSKTTTTTSTKFSTITVAGNTKTATSTTTVYTTVISTTVETSSSTVTTTETSTSISTTTIGTSSGYTPLQSQIASLGYTPRKRDLHGYPPIVARRAEPAVVDAARSSRMLPGVFPTKVSCTQDVQVITTTTSIVTGSKTATTTLKRSTAIFTSTSYVTSTVTVFKAKASTTITTTTTSTISSTTTSTSYSYSTVTETSTVIGPSTTSYALCNDPSNYLHQVNGINAKFYKPERDSPAAYDLDIKDEVSCCSACAALGPRCAVGLSLGPIGCYFIAQDSTLSICDPVSPAGFFQTGTETEQSNTAIFNTNCGRWRYDVAGSDPM